jgi:hypothetical protein
MKDFFSIVFFATAIGASSNVFTQKGVEAVGSGLVAGLFAIAVAVMQTFGKDDK